MRFGVVCEVVHGLRTRCKRVGEMVSACLTRRPPDGRRSAGNEWRNRRTHAVATDKEDGIEISSSALVLGELVGVLGQLKLLLEELLALLVLLEGLDAAWVERGLATLGRRKLDLDTLVDELVVGVCSLGEVPLGAAEQL